MKQPLFAHPVPLCVRVCLPDLSLQHPALNPEVEAALKQLLASPEVKAQFHDPAVHAALQEVSSSRSCMSSSSCTLVHMLHAWCRAAVCSRRVAWQWCAACLPAQAAPLCTVVGPGVC